MTAPHATNPAKPMDWTEVHRRVDTVRLAIEGRQTLGPEESRAILLRRAEELAERLEPGPAGQDRIGVIEFVIAGQVHALPSSQVREVLPPRTPTPVPCTPPFVTGIINLRGQIVAVFDLERFFGLASPEPASPRSMVIIRHGAREAGILAEPIVGNRLIDLGQLEPPPPTLRTIPERWLSGVSRQGVILLDAAAMLEDPRLQIYDEVDG